MATFDDVIEEVGAFGRYQALLMVMFMCVTIPVSYNTFLPLFILTTPGHRCALPGYDNDTYAVQSPWHRGLINRTIPWDSDTDQMSSCSMFAPVGNGSSWTNPSQVHCEHWVYDREYFDRTLIEELHLVCGRKLYRSHANTAMMAGKLVSAVLQGFLSDTFGRRFTLMLFLIVVISSSFANAFIFNIPSLIAFRFLAGLSSTSVYMNAYVISLEFLGTRYRQRFNLFAALSWLTGGFVLTGVAYFIRDYNTLTVVLAAPTVLLISYFFLVPESARWLVSKDRTEEARTILERVAKFNKKSFPKEIFEKLIQKRNSKQSCVGTADINSNRKSGEKGEGDWNDVVAITNADEPTESQKHTKRTEHFFQVFRHKRLFVRLLIVFWNWCANSMAYYGILFNTQNLSGSIYVNFSLTNTVDAAGNIVAYYFVDKTGRKKSYIAFSTIASLALLAAIFPSIYGTRQEADQWIVILAITGRAGVSITFNIMYLFVAELFPTTMRNSILGASSMASRVGSLSAPYFADLGVLLGGYMKAALPLAVFGGAGLLATVSAIFLPETVGKNLPTDINDALDIDRETRAKEPKCQEKHVKAIKM